MDCVILCFEGVRCVMRGVCDGHKGTVYGCLRFDFLVQNSLLDL